MLLAEGDDPMELAGALQVLVPVPSRFPRRARVRCGWSERVGPGRVTRALAAACLVVVGCTEDRDAERPRRGASPPPASASAPATRAAESAPSRLAVALEVDEAPEEGGERIARVALFDAPDGRRRERTVQAKLAEGRWLEIRLRAAVAARVALHDPLGRTREVGRAGDARTYRIDFLQALLHAPPEILGRADGDLVATEAGVDVALDVEDGGERRRVHVHAVVPEGAEEDLVARLHRVSKEPIAWAAEYRAAAPGPHPLILLLADSDGRRARVDMGTLPRRFDVRDVQLIAIATEWSRVVGTCPLCADISGLYGKEPCERKRHGLDVVIYAARTGRRVARKELRGAPPPKCAPRGETTNPFAVHGPAAFSETVEWARGFAIGRGST